MDKILIYNKKWDDLVKLITPFDLVLFAGEDLVSSTIRNLQNKKLQVGDFSHVGVLVSSFVLPHIKELQHGEWYVWESTSSLKLPGFENEVPDVFQKHKLGVQIRNLKKVIDIYKGDIYIAKLKKNPLFMDTHLSFDPSSYHSPSSATTPEMLTNTPVEPCPDRKDSLEQKEDDTIAKFIAELSTPKDERTKASYEFDNIIKEINSEIDMLDKMLSSEYRSSNDKSPDSFDVSCGIFREKIQQTIRDINEIIDATSDITKQIEKDLDSICIQMNKIVDEKCKGTKRYKKIVKDVRQIYEIYGNRMYNASVLDLLSALYPILRPFRNFKYKILKKLSRLLKNKKIEPQALFCSQFVAIVYSKLGIIDKNIDFKNFVPVDFLGCDEDGQKSIVSTIFKIIKND